MARYYIDVDKAYDAIDEKTKGKPPEYCGIAEEFMQAVDNLPAADVVPRSEVEEIFEEIEFEIHQLDFDRDETRAIAIEGIIANAKKKYTEEGG